MTDDIRNRLAEVLWGAAPIGTRIDVCDDLADAILEAFGVTEKAAALSQPEQAEIERVKAERDVALSTIAKVRELHVPHQQTGKCAECTYAPFSQQSVAWPCPTVRAIREEVEDE